MLFFIAIACIVLIVCIAYSSGGNNNKIPFTNIQSQSVELSVPNPETANPKDVVRFILSRDSDVVRQIYHQLKQKGIIIPEQLDKLFHDKINCSLLYYRPIYWGFDIKEYQMEKENLSQYSDQYYFGIKGLQVKSYQKKLEDCVVYDQVTLKKEPHNKYDPNAIKVVSPSGLIGYVPRDETDEVKSIIDKSHKAFIFRITDIDGFIDSDVVIYYNLNLPNEPHPGPLPEGEEKKTTFT